MAIKILGREHRDVRSLIRAGDDTEKVSSHDFRSADEVLFYIRDLIQRVNDDAAKLKALRRVFSAYQRFMPSLEGARMQEHAIKMDITRIDRDATLPNKVKPKYQTGIGTGQASGEVNIPNPQKFKENFDLLKSLQSKIDVLDTLEAQVAQEFRSERTPLTQALKEARSKINRVYNATLKFISKGVDKKQPDLFRSTVDEIMAPVLLGLEGNFDSMTDTVLLTLQEEKNDIGTTFYVFNRYYQFQNLDNGDEFVYPEYVIVFTAVVTPALKMFMYVNVLHRFRPPGHFKFGLAFNDIRSGKHELESLLSADSMVDALEPQHMPYDTMNKEKFAVRPHITDFSVLNDNLIIKLHKVPNNQLEELTKNLLNDVRAAIGRSIKGKSLKYRIEKTGTGKYTFKFKLALEPSDQMREKGLNPQRVKILRTMFGADDEDIRNIEHVLLKGQEGSDPNWTVHEEEEE